MIHWEAVIREEKPPMWTIEHRKAACRKGLRYDSDMTDEEWALVARLIPPAKRRIRGQLT